MYGRTAPLQGKTGSKKERENETLAPFFQASSLPKGFFGPSCRFFCYRENCGSFLDWQRGPREKKVFGIDPPFCFGRYNRSGVHPNQPMEEGKEERGGGGGGGGSDRSSGDQLHGKEKEGKGKSEERCGIGQSWRNKICNEQVKWYIFQKGQTDCEGIRMALSNSSPKIRQTSPPSPRWGGIPRVAFRRSVYWSRRHTHITLTGICQVFHGSC